MDKAMLSKRYEALYTNMPGFLTQNLTYSRGGGQSGLVVTNFGYRDVQGQGQYIFSHGLLEEPSMQVCAEQVRAIDLSALVPLPPIEPTPLNQTSTCIMITVRLTGCSVCFRTEADVVQMAHVRPPPGSTGVQLQNALVATHQWEVVFGRNDYIGAHQGANVFGIRGKFYAQIVNLNNSAILAVRQIYPAAPNTL